MTIRISQVPLCCTCLSDKYRMTYSRLIIVDHYWKMKPFEVCEGSSISVFHRPVSIGERKGEDTICSDKVAV